jgi:hypothetical protein
LKLTAVKSLSPQIVVVPETKLLKPGESDTIQLSVTPRKGDRLLSGYLTIATDNPSKSEIRVPVYGTAAE